ncbi:hypothetical protein JQ628_25705 [Bradyrhizobium lablabi]|uniref:hypothetical protein n=1 Tax=Bradyrhizobium lablabi TaxID=722472 RepID=UPI001BA8C309|nr:hypothetical protein [Bradyrhizobium lablabi]MBR1124943.1 hypothetical protein [Bradyrhizobium lablabi]
MNGDLLSALLSWWPFVLFVAAWFLFGRTQILSLMRPRASSEGTNTPESRHDVPTGNATDDPAWFAAMEYYAFILNRTYKVFVTDQMLVGATVRGLVISPPVVSSSMLNQEFWVRTQTAKRYERIDPTSAKLLQMHSANFQVHWNDIAQTEYRAGKKWGMGNVPHSGRLVLQLRDGRQRELILLGRQNGNTLKEKFDHLVQASTGKAPRVNSRGPSGVTADLRDSR